jgi:signal transduction histidine kinase/ligand-binding sensor domain-containing protein
MTVASCITHIASQKVSLWIILLSLYSIPLHGIDRDRKLDQLYHQAWTFKDGAPTEVHALAQTTDGYLWLGSASGLFRFDGLRFEQFQLPSGETSRVRNVSSLFATPDGGLWVGYWFGGVSLIKDEKVINYGKRDGLPSDTVLSFARDRHGRIWIATGRDGLARLEGTGWRKIGAEWGLTEAANTVFVDRKGTVWVGTPTRVLYLTENATHFQTAAQNLQPVVSIAEGSEGTLWIAERLRGIRSLSLPGRDTSSQFPEILLPAQAIMIDGQGNLWIVAPGEGVVRIPYPERLGPSQVEKSDPRLQKLTPPTAVTADQVYCVLQDHAGNMWFGTRRGLGQFQQTALVSLHAPSNPVTALGPSRDRTLSELHHTIWTAKDGVPGEVLALAQTKDGYLWLGTANGLCRFDGAHFERYEPPPAQRFPSHIIESLFAAPDGGLFIGFRNAGASFLKDEQVTNYGPANGMPPGTVRSFARTPDGSIWAATSAGLRRLSNGHWQAIGEEWGYMSPRAQSVFVDRGGTLWVATEDGVVFLSSGKNRFQPTPDRVSDRPFEANKIVQAPDGRIWIAETTRGVRPVVVNDEVDRRSSPEVSVGSSGILFDDAGSLWITSLGDGIGRVLFPERLNGQGRRLFRDAAEIYSEKDGLSSDHASPVLEDREGNIWVGTSTGLDRFQQTNVVPVGLPTGSNDMILIAGDHSDIWTASLNRGLTHVEGRSLTVQHQDFTWATTCGYRDQDGSLWLGGPPGIRHFADGKFADAPLPENIRHTWAVAITPGGPGVLWAAFAREGVFRLAQGEWTHFDTHAGLPEDLPTNMFTDSSGNVWIGYLRNRIARFDGKTFRTFSQDSGITVGDVMTIYQHGTHLWIGGEFGLQLFVKERFEKIRPVNESDFVGISGIVEAANGDLWLNAANGILHVAAAEVQHALKDTWYPVRYQSFNYLDGLPGTSAKLRARPTAIQGTDGRLWFSLANGVVWMDPTHMRTNAIAPPVYVTLLEADGKRYLSPAGLKLPVGSTNLRIAYTALSLSVPERVRFRYILDHLDPNWQDPGGRREAFYTNLGPGPHRFRVIASNNDGVWNETGASLDFSIAPAYYQTNWFLALCVTAFLLLLWVFYQMRLRQLQQQFNIGLEARVNERTRIARELHDTLLQSLHGLMFQFQAARNMLPRSPENAMQTLDEAISGTEKAIAESRDAIQDLRPASVAQGELSQLLKTVAEELAAAQRPNHKSPVFHVIVEGEPRVLSPIVQHEVYNISREVIRNAFHHANARQIEVEIRYDKSQFRLRVRDDGKGIDPAVLEKSRRPGHWGLPGVRERAKRIRSRLGFWSQAGAGTEVELTVPAAVAYKAFTEGSWLKLFRKAVNE